MMVALPVKGVQGNATKFGMPTAQYPLGNSNSQSLAWPSRRAGRPSAPSDLRPTMLTRSLHIKVPGQAECCCLKGIFSSFLVLGKAGHHMQHCAASLTSVEGCPISTLLGSESERSRPESLLPPSPSRLVCCDSAAGSGTAGFTSLGCSRW